MKKAWLRLIPLASAVFLVISCGGGAGPGTYPQDLGEASGDHRPSGVEIFIGVDAEIGNLEVIGAEEVQGSEELSNVEALEDLAPGDKGPSEACASIPKPFGCPCEKNDECESQWCIDVSFGRICTMECLDRECPEGYGCFSYKAGQDVFFLCMPRYTTLCQPCKTHKDCQAQGDASGSACLEYQNGESYCGAPCPDGKCPNGYECVEALLSDGTPTMQCKKVSGPCECNNFGKVMGMATTCLVKNDYGTCKGERKCLADGLSECDAPEAAPEVCDLLDNDCNGVTDDLPKDATCKVSNEYGECPGKPQCVNGNQVCVGETPKPEQCDGLDNNCNGFTDEGFADTDGDGKADCVDPDDDNDGIPDETDNCPTIVNPDQADFDGDKIGDACDQDMDGDLFPNGIDCGPKDPLTYPGAQEVCDGVDNNCNGLVDEGICDDGIACTFDYCDIVQKQCVHVGDNSKCNDKNPCTKDTCVVGSGCTFTPLSGVECDDGDSCTFGDTCVNGQCIGTPWQGCCKTSADCDDKNPCTLDKCNVATGECSHDATAMEGQKCNADDNGCTLGDQCIGGSCVPGNDVKCPSPPNQCELAICQSGGPYTYSCVTMPAPKGTACDDKNPCTVMDQCDGAGHCVPGPQSPLCCTSNSDCDDHNPCTIDICNLGTGECIHTNAPDNTPCDADSNGCTQGDFCKAGTCVPGAPVSCPASPDPCKVNKCVSTGPTSYQCSLTPAPAGTPCSDGDICTLNDQCDGSGNCVPGPQAPSCCKSNAQCNDGNPCTIDICEIATGKCTYTNAADNTPCDADSNGCTQGDFCKAGTCVPGAPVSCPASPDPCKVNKCVSTGPTSYQCSLTPAPAGTPCNDGNICTLNDQCDGQGQCQPGAPIPNCCTKHADCDDNNPCTNDTCDVQSGTCKNTPVADGTFCNADNDGCTVGDYCLNGSCKAGAPAVCQQEGPCVIKTCLSTGPDTYTCKATYADQTVPCDDGKYCTVEDHCDGQGACVGGRPRDCGGEQGCTIWACSEAEQKCVAENKPDGSPCNADDNGCTVGDKCQGGACVPGPNADCSNLGDACNIGKCESLGADFYKCTKQPKPAGVPCDDGLFCTVNEACDGQGSCKGGEERDCQAEVGDQCNTGYCDEALKTCVKQKKPDGTPCDDGNVCTLVDACYNGQCVGSQDGCVEERISVSGPGERTPSIGSLGYGRYVTWWTGNGNAQNYLRLSDAYGSRENEEASPPMPSGSQYQPYGRLAVTGTGDFLVSYYGGASSGSCIGTCTASFAGNLAIAKLSYDGSLVNYKNVLSVSGSLYAYYANIFIDDLKAIPLAFSDGTFGTVVHLSVNGGSASPPEKTIVFVPLASDLTPGTVVRLVDGQAKDAPVTTDARLSTDQSDTFLVSWVDTAGTKVYVQRFTKSGQPDLPNPVLVSDEGSNQVSRTVVLGFSDGKFLVAWEVANKDGSGLGVYAKRFYADGTAIGPEFRVNQNVQGDQRLGDVAAFSDNSFVFVYDDSKADVVGYGVVARRFNAQGQALGNAFLVNTISAGDQYRPTVEVLSTQEFVVAYVDSNKAVWTRRFLKDGTPSMGKVEVRVNQTTSGSQTSPKAAVAANGNVMVVWNTPVFGQEVSEVMARLFDSAGQEKKGEFQVNTYNKNAQSNAAVAGGPDRFVVVWESEGQDGSGAGVFGKIFDSAGTALSSEFGVNTTTTDFQRSPSVAMVSNGNFLVAWSGASSVAGSTSDIYARIFDKDGKELKGEFVVNQTLAKPQEKPFVAAAYSGNQFLVAWESKDQDGDLYGIFMRKFDSSGNPLSDEVRVNSTTANDQRNVSLAVSPDNQRVLACWDTYNQDAPNSWGVACQYFNLGDLSMAGQEFLVNVLKAGHQRYPSVAWLPGTGGALVAWASEGIDSSGFGIHVRRFTTSGSALGPRVVANRYWDSNQWLPFVVAVSSSTYFVGWQSEGQDGDGSGIYMRVLPPPQ